MSELKSVLLSSITMIKNYRDVEPVTEKAADIIELADSIKKHGVMQPVLLRPGKKNGSYELIFGHRRFMASKLAGNADIPANIKDVIDDDILEFQVTENLQRKDVHPMDEAVAFKSLIDGKKYTIDEIAARFAKKPEFVAQRLSLNSLIDAGRKAFLAGKFLLGHALLISRMTADNQKDILKNDYNLRRTVSDLKETIDQNFTLALSAAPWKKDDAQLFPAAGACSTCLKRTGCQPELFADVKGDRCIDKTCYEKKGDLFFVKRLRDVLETETGTYLINDSYSKPDDESAKLIKEMKAPVLKQYSDFSSHSYSDFKTKAKGFCIAGYSRGKTETIYLKAKSANKSVDGKALPSQEIKGIQERMDRSRELDLQKIHIAILEECKKKKEFESKAHPLQAIDRGIMVFLLLTSAGLENDTIKGVPDYPEEGGYNESYFKRLSQITDDSLAIVIRMVCMDKFGNKNMQYGIKSEDTTMRLIASYLGVDIKSIEDAQKEITDKREARAKQRIEALKPKKSAVKKLAKSK